MRIRACCRRYNGHCLQWCTSVCDPLGGLAFYKMSLFPSFLCLQAHPSRLAEVLMLHESHPSVPSELTPKCTLSISPPTLGVVPFLHRMRPSWPCQVSNSPDSYLSTCMCSTMPRQQHRIDRAVGLRFSEMICFVCGTGCSWMY
jgi:hypothetical protein